MTLMRLGYVCLAVMVLASVPSAALSHAALLKAETVTAIRLHAVFDTGAPMAMAQVVIHAPYAPAEIWGRGLTDSEGRFEFVPGPQEGRWSVQVRQAGHGVLAHVDITDNGARLVAAQSAPSLLQRAVMVSLVLWGALGTALYYRRRQGGQNASA